jgi:hypothetical protein
MHIELMEGDELTQPDGKPRNIFLSIEGKKMILPTNKTILDLLDIGKGIEPSKATLEPLIPLKTENKPIVEEQPKAKDLTGEIQREDLVKCIFVKERFKDKGGAELIESGLILGKIYRVLKVSKVGVTEPGTNELVWLIKHYELIDDKAEIPTRIYAFPGEVELFQKRGAPLEKIMVPSEMFTCSCGTINALLLDTEKNKYIGKCGNPDCGKVLGMDRPAKKEEVKVA